MVKKQRDVRDGDEDGNGDSSDRRGISHKRCQPDKDSISLEEIVSQLQPWFRETVRKEVNQALSLSRVPYVRLAENSQGCNLELRFASEVAHTQFSGIPVEADDRIPLRIMLVDRATRETVVNGYKKHHPPFLQDEVWRLEQIRKDGPLHHRLRSHGINTVVDFLRRYEVDPPALKSILGAGTHRRTWNAIVDHANTCVVDDGTFWACHFASENVILKLNFVYRVVAAAGADFGNQNYVPLENLTLRQKAIVESLKPEAQKRRSEWLLVDAGADWTPNLLQNEPWIGQQGVVQEPNNYESAEYQQPGLSKSPEAIHSIGALDVGEVSPLFLEAFECDAQATTAEYVIEGVGNEDCCEWLSCSFSCSTWAEGQPLLINGMGMNSNRSSSTSLNTLASSSHKEYQQKEEDPPRL